MGVSEADQLSVGARSRTVVRATRCPLRCCLNGLRDRLALAQVREVRDLPMRQRSFLTSSTELILVANRVTNDCSDHFHNRERFMSHNVVEELIRNQSSMPFTGKESLEIVERSSVAACRIPS